MTSGGGADLRIYGTAETFDHGRPVIEITPTFSGTTASTRPRPSTRLATNDPAAPSIARRPATDGAPLLLLHTAGAKTGKERINPMMYQDLGNGSIAVFASKAGADTHPDWYHNISAHPDVTAEIGTETRGFAARTASGDERAPIWDQQKIDYPGFADYEAGTTRQIPVVILDPT